MILRYIFKKHFFRQILPFKVLSEKTYDTTLCILQSETPALILLLLCNFPRSKDHVLFLQTPI